MVIFLKKFNGLNMNTAISERALTQIRHQMLKFAQLQLHNTELAEDVVQEAFLSAFSHLDSFKHEAAFKTWVFAILKNKIIDYLRTKQRWVLESELANEDETSANTFFDEHEHWNAAYMPTRLPDGETQIYTKEFWLIFETCLHCLPAKQAKIFMMREFLELNSEEICQQTQLSTANLYILLYRARLQLQHCLSQKL